MSFWLYGINKTIREKNYVFLKIFLVDVLTTEELGKTALNDIGRHLF